MIKRLLGLPGSALSDAPLINGINPAQSVIHFVYHIIPESCSTAQQSSFTGRIAK
jgi:hypothetical protein